MTERDYRAGFVAIVGRPNVGKSTLMNQIVGEKIAIATPKPQTTRDRIRGIRTFDDWQVVYVDTPGIHEARTALNKFMVDTAIGTLSDVDLTYLLVDAAHGHAKPDQVLAETERVVAAISAAGARTILVVNKVDKLRDKAALLPLIEKLTALYPFDEVVPVSAATGDGVDRLLALTRPRLPEGPALFPGDELTDRSMRFLAAELVREQLFMQLSDELPYHVAVNVEDWQERDNGTAAIHATIHVARDSHKGIVIGKGGQRLKSIGQKARQNLEDFMQRKVWLELHVRVEDDWVDRAAALRKLGYTEQ